MVPKGSSNNSGWRCLSLFSPRVTLLYCLAIVALSGMGNVASAESWVKVWNNLGEGQLLSVSCESSHDATKSQRVIGFNEVYYFKFHGFTVRWWCEFEWQNQTLFQSIVVWDNTGTTEMPVKCGQCLWEAHPDGWWVWNKSSNSWQIFVKWKEAEELGSVLTESGKSNVTMID